MRQIIILFFLLISFEINAQKIKVHENHQSSPLNKPGWNLIYHDEFDSSSLNKSVWNIADFNNDGTLHCTDPNDFPFTMNPKNVWVEDGLCKIAITTEDYLECGASAGEIKSYSVNPADTIHSWTLDHGFYIEIRIKNLPIQTGLGSAGWLFAGGQLEYNEIDIWETDGKNKHKYGSTYWWDENESDCANDRGLKQDHSVFRVKNLNDRVSLFGIKLWSRKMDLTNQWLVYGVDWSDDHIKYYLNGVKTKEINFNSKFNPNNVCAIDDHDKPIYPKNIRIGTGPNSLGDKESSELAEGSLPKTLNIDYVRVYSENGSNPIKIRFMPDEMCYGSADNMTCSYIPGVIYSWESEGFNFQQNDENLMSSRWAEVKNDIEVNKYYPVTVTSIFPDGHIEKTAKSVFICGDADMSAKTVIPIQRNSDCNFWAAILLNNESEKMFWSEDFGTSWEEGQVLYHEGKYYSIYGEFYGNLSYLLTIKNSNACGISSSATMELNTPTNHLPCELKLSGTTDKEHHNNSVITDTLKEGNQMKVVTLESFHNILNTSLFEGTVYIYNFSGQRVTNFRISDPNTIPVENAGSGLYLVLLYNSENKIMDKLYILK